VRFTNDCRSGLTTKEVGAAHFNGRMDGSLARFLPKV
jgi:hypothetical protein